LVHALYACFDYFGGMPKQLVYDQDSIIVVSENGGDIIHTQGFAAFLAETKLDVRVCRKSDPETKGIVEASVKFVKGNFMENRYFMDLNKWQESFEDWLDRTGNGQKHGTTKRKPGELFIEEQEYLLPLFGTAPTEITNAMDRNVRPDNTVLYSSNRYTVPLGTYALTKKAYLAVDGKKLEIMDPVGDTIAIHEISSGKGKLIKLPGHRRNKKTRIAEMLDKAVALLGEDFREYLRVLCEKYPRYVKEQLDIVVQSCENHGREHVLEAVRYCQDLALYSANDLNDAVRAMCGDSVSTPQPMRIPATDERYHIPVQKRALSIYADVAAGSGVAQ
jgi:hypothetical protein